MALSNWDTLAVDEKSEPTNGVFVSENSKVSVEIYKNWLYVRDPDKTKEVGFSGSTVMEIQEGDMTYKDVKITAKRGPQNGVFCIIQTGYAHDNTLLVMVGCGVYGFDGGEWIGVNEESKKFLQDWISEKRFKSEDEVRKYLLEDIGWREILEEHPESSHTENKEDFEEEVKKCLEQTVFDKEIASITITDALRFNQGDKYFADRLGEEIPATEVGKADMPTLLKMIGKEDTESKDE